jgi:hypothetical protein
MHQTFQQRRRLRAASKRHTDLSFFTPAVRVAHVKVESLLAAGARVLAVYPNKVVLRRQDSVATVDDWGRVTWAAAQRRPRNLNLPR